MKKVLIVEDDVEITHLLEIHLKDLGCEVLSATRGDIGLKQAIKELPDLIILDVMLPEMDGIEICQKIRAKNITSPIMMLTARSEEIDKVLGLEVGADDYLTKPFSVREFIARVKAIFRRQKMDLTESNTEKDAKLMHFDSLSIDIEMRKVILDGKKIELSPKEFELLVLLSSNPGKSYDRSKLLNMIWGYDFHGYEHTVNSHINRLRSKIEPDMGNPKFILTTWGVGYKFNEELLKP
ncbi:response regulator transcription factor [Flagellimonas zhangzhouensis]|uniref:Phosphate regulon transcriptional regulatory protein PhoB n=1 Tax=Flagellimonas zhangzhouensis TaxID=1073328 RepID=A0A1H2WRP0_9FLAO|nr:response regulator transcription factor [Allomuricauda zhangzhouensis]SDQ24041.1 DNA-binding response regulator, OmpR family, contains REC and winged-helix (wHTH) domain [Allomuricauda zhangzhouensis]SDW83225.1 DNA-binding response regulator, OmpR family, contains REC and winged-helix (wHTH) domain [Allomuricauda zhangzhouensis]